MGEDRFDKGGERLRRALKARRKELKMSQEELCRKMGRARTFVSKYELGERTLSFPEVLELCRWLQLDEQAFIDGIKGDIPARDAASGLASAIGPEPQEAEPRGDMDLAAAEPHEESGGKGMHS